MANKPKVSVIIPVYNCANYLRQALDSIVNQTLKEIEIICIDDFSTDESYSILEEYAQKDDRIVVIRLDENKGVAEARNKGLEIATGEYIMFLDNDDWYELNACELCYEQISQNMNDFVLYSYNKYYEETKEYKVINKMIKPFKAHLNNPNINLDEVKTNFVAASFIWAAIYSKKFLDENDIRFKALRTFEDHTFFADIILHARTISVINKPLYNHRVFYESATYKFLQQDEHIYNAKKYIIKQIKKLRPSKNRKAALYTYSIITCLHWYNVYSVIFPQIDKKFYKNIRKIFNMMNSEYIENVVRKRLTEKQYEKYRLVVLNNYYKYKIYDIFSKSLKNLDNYIRQKYFLHNYVPKQSTPFSKKLS